MNEYLPQGSLVIWRIEQHGSAVPANAGVNYQYGGDGENNIYRVGNVFHSQIPVRILHHNPVNPGPGIGMLCHINVLLVVVRQNRL
ncbi:MAG: hypothetical protein BWY95_01299 [Bacteroidetes bacterium ADurb.BinA104]|nr:MAG: hypothetical protein BWY95_01299 [Bacteroidetes bacterium ADurb.BinA104]